MTANSDGSSSKVQQDWQNLGDCQHLLFEQMTNQINTFATNCNYQIMIGLKYNHGIHNEELYKRLNQIPLALAAIYRQLTWEGHILRRKGKELIKRYAFYEPENFLRTNGQKKGWNTKGTICKVSLIKSHLKWGDALTAEELTGEGARKVD